VLSLERVVFVHGSGRFGAAAWPKQHGLSLDFDCLYLRRHGFDAEAEPLATDHDRDQEIVAEALGAGGHVVAHAEGAVPAMLLAVERPDLVGSLTLIEPACLSLTAGLPATKAHIDLMAPLVAERHAMSDGDFLREFLRRGSIAEEAEEPVDGAGRNAARLRLQSPPWEAPLSIVPGVPTLVLTGGWEPLYEEVAQYLAGTGAIHRVVPGGHRPHDTPEGAALIRAFLRSAGEEAAA
jgi:pimeloyl-ACP methyl ester carboxylesterase